MQAITASVLLWLLPVALGESESDAADSQGTDSGAEGEPEELQLPQGEQEDEELHAANAVLFLFTALVFGIVLRRAMSRFIIPYTGLLVVAGMGIGFLNQDAGVGAHGAWEEMGQGIRLWLNMPPSLFLLVFLPILLYGSGSALDWHTFFRNINPILTLAFPGVGIHMVLVAVIYKFVFPYDWSWKEAFLFGSIISATDPVAVVAIMKEVGASKRLGHLIEGESLLNDGSAFVLFVVFQNLLTSASPPGPGAIVRDLLVSIFLALLLGIGFGLVTTMVLAFVYRDTVLEITLTVASAFLCFWVAEDILEVSGVLAVVTLAIWMAAVGKYAISPEVSHSMHLFWEVSEFMANTLVFFVSGVIVAERIYVGHNPTDGEPILLRGGDWGWAILNWVLLNIIRFVTIAMLKPLMNRIGADGFTWYDVIVATWAGLRGAVGLSLGLILYLSSIEEGSNIEPRFALITVFFVGTMSILTILVQGTTMPWLLFALRITKKTPVQVQHLLMAAKEVEEFADRNLSHLKNDHVLGPPDWDEVLTATAIDFGELLPSKKDLRRLIATMDQADAESVYAHPDASSQLMDSTTVPDTSAEPGSLPTVSSSTRKRTSVPSAGTLSSVRSRNGSGRRRNSVQVERLEECMNKMDDKSRCSVHEVDEETLPVSPSLHRESLAALKTEGDAEEVETERRIRSTLSTNLDAMRAGHGSGSVPGELGVPGADVVADAFNGGQLGGIGDPSADDFAEAGVATGTKTVNGVKEMAEKQKEREMGKNGRARFARRREKTQKQSITIERLLNAFQKNEGDEISMETTLQDLRARYLHSVSAVYAEGFEKGYLNGEQQATLHNLTASALDKTDAPIGDFEALRTLVNTPLYIRLLVKLLITLGRVLPFFRSLGERVLFLNLESDIGSAAAFVFAHGEAIKAMHQMLHVVKDAHECLDGDNNPAADAEVALVEQVIQEGTYSRDQATDLLACFKRDYPTLVRAVKTRAASQTVLMHKSRFVNGMLKAGLLEEKEGNQLLELIQARVKALYFGAPTIDLPTTYDVIHKHYLFEHFTDADCKSLLESGHTVVYNPSEHLFRAGQPPLRVFVILRGTATRWAEDGRSVRVNGTGAAVGLGEALTDIPRLSNVQADTHIEAFYLTTRVFKHIMDANETFRLRAYQIAAASVSLQMRYTFVKGMAFHELLETFKSSRLLPDVKQGDEISITGRCLLMSGSVIAYVAGRQMTNLKRIGNTRAVLRRTSALPPCNAEDALATCRKSPHENEEGDESPTQVATAGESTTDAANEETPDGAKAGDDAAGAKEGEPEANATGGDGEPLQGAFAAKAGPFLNAAGGLESGKDVVINAPALLDPGTYPVASHSVVLTLPSEHQSEERDYPGNMKDAIRNMTLYRQSQVNPKLSRMGGLRGAVGDVMKSNLTQVDEDGGGGVPAGEGAQLQRQINETGSLTRASMPVKTTFVKGDGHATMASPSQMWPRQRRMSHEGVVQVPTISRGSAASQDGAVTPSAAEGQPPLHADHPGAHTLYAVPEAGESNANMLAGWGDAFPEGDADAVEGGSEGVADAGPESDTAAADADADEQQLNSTEGTPKATE